MVEIGTDPLSLTLGVTGIVIGILITTLVGYYFFWRTKEEGYKQKIENLEKRIKEFEDSIREIVEKK